MEPEYRLTQPAMQDTQDISEYLAEKAGFTQAETFIQKLNAQFTRIARFPKLGRLRDDLQPGCRMLFVDRYKIFYIPSDRSIEILRIVSVYRDLSTVFPSDN